MYRKHVIRSKMEELNISVRDVAAETGVSLTTVYRFINGKRNSWILQRWCWDRLGIDADALPDTRIVDRRKEVQR